MKIICKLIYFSHVDMLKIDSIYRPHFAANEFKKNTKARHFSVDVGRRKIVQFSA